ncbi:hypothetical protein [Desulfobacterium sp. N47]|uniref:Aspartate kinase n=1 Tax=uncultured Desulfobacterium sp. TaxID=201089 RepID=E1YDF6_9BACT|nr:unknown protein [uncultured Desulfobacterium sp.]
MNPTLSKLPIGGLKLSSELVQIRLLPNSGFSANEMFSLLADRRINMTMVSIDATDNEMTGICYIFEEDRTTAERALLPLAAAIELLSPVGAITIFPHRFRLFLIENILSAMGKDGLPVYGIASSNSALTITTDYHRLDDAVSAVCRIVSLPENHAPFRPEFRIKQF